jgi:hypothetical protein
MKVVLAYGITSPLSAIASSHSFQSQAGPLVSVMPAGQQWQERGIIVVAVGNSTCPALNAQLRRLNRRREVLYASKAALAQPHASGESASTITQIIGVSGCDGIPSAC